MAHVGRVPVEHRFFGLDRRTLPYAFAAVAVWALWTIVLPWIDNHVAWNDPVRPGQRIQLTDDVSFAPAVGWGVQSGLRTTDVTASGQKATSAVVLTTDGVVFEALRGAWRGTPRALLNQITKITSTEAGRDGFELSSQPTSIQTSTGKDGVLASFRTPRTEGLIAAFVFGDQGLQIQVVGSPDQLEHRSEEIARMISSIRQEQAG